MSERNGNMSAFMGAEVDLRSEEYEEKQNTLVDLSKTEMTASVQGNKSKHTCGSIENRDDS